MSLRANIDHAIAVDGVDAIYIQDSLQMGEESAFRGDPRFEALLRRTTSLLCLADEPRLRIVMANHTVVAQREGDQFACVLTPTGHPVAKSLRRMIRRMAQRERRARVRPPGPMIRDLKIPEPVHVAPRTSLFGF